MSTRLLPEIWGGVDRHGQPPDPSPFSLCITLYVVRVVSGEVNKDVDQ